MSPDAWIAAAAITYPAVSVAAGLMFGLWITRNRRDHGDGYDTIPFRDEKLPVPGPAGLPGQAPRAAAPALGHGDFREWEQEMRRP